MKLHLKFNVIALFILAYQQTCTGNPLAVIMTVKDIGDKISTGAEFISTAMNKDDTSQILEKVNIMAKDIDIIKHMIEDYGVIMFQKLLPEIAAIQSLEILKNEIRRLYNKVNQEYEEHFLKYSKADFSKIDPALEDTILNWSLRMIDETNDNRLEAYLLDIHSQYNGYLKQLIELIKRNKNRCVTSGQSDQLTIAYEYSNFALLQLKGFLIIKYSYETLGAKYAGDTKGKINIASEYYQNRTDEIRRDLINNVDGLSREFWRCDPEKHTNETWAELQVKEKFLVNTKDLHPVTYDTCPIEAELSWNCAKGDCITKGIRMCNGKISACYTIGTSVKICPNEPNSYKRFKYIISHKRGWAPWSKGETRVFGKTVKCPNEIETSYSESGGYTTTMVLTYAYCLCDCTNEPTMNNKINLAPAYSDYNDNKVITGVKLVLEKGIWSLKIQQGFLGPKGTIDEKTVEWKDVRYETLYGKDLRIKTLGYRNYRIYMYDTMAPKKNSALVGLNFVYKEDKGLTVDAEFAYFDFKTGKIEALKKENDIDFTKESEIIHERYEMPINTQFKSDTISKQNAYINLITSTTHEDGSQTTIPLLDIQPVEPIPHVPLSGFGIYHKSRLSSGFIGLKVYTFDYNPFFK